MPWNLNKMLQLELLLSFTFTTQVLSKIEALDNYFVNKIVSLWLIIEMYIDVLLWLKTLPEECQSHLVRVDWWLLLFPWRASVCQCRLCGMISNSSGFIRVHVNLYKYGIRFILQAVDCVDLNPSNSSQCAMHCLIFARQRRMSVILLRGGWVGGYVSRRPPGVTSMGWVCFQCWPPGVTSKGGWNVQRGAHVQGE